VAVQVEQVGRYINLAVVPEVLLAPAAATEQTGVTVLLLLAPAVAAALDLSLVSQFTAVTPVLTLLVTAAHLVAAVAAQHHIVRSVVLAVTQTPAAAERLALPDQTAVAVAVAASVKPVVMVLTQAAESLPAAQRARQLR
jgi:hypothetical protein